MNAYEWMLQYQRNNDGTNQAPKANAGPDVNLTLPANSTQLNGNNSWDLNGAIVGYSWSRISGPTQYTFNNSNIVNPVLSNLAVGTYTFRLTVTDNQGSTATDDIIVTENATPSIPGRIEAENYYAMSGIQTEYTADVDGNRNVGWIDQGDWMDYNANVSSSGTYRVNFRVANPDPVGQFQLRKADGTVLATLSVPTTGDNQAWTTINTNVTLQAGNQTIRLISTAASHFNINWLEFVAAAGTNQPPTANAGADKTITLPTNSVSLTGSATDADGTIGSYAWTKISGPTTFTITSPSSASTTVTGLVQGTYVFRLTATDNALATGTDDVQVIVNTANNALPVANAGTDLTITLPTNSVTLTGSGTDADGTIASYLWTKISGPTQGTINTPAAAQTTLSNLVQGTYVFELKVTDNLTATGTDNVTVVVNPSGSTALPIPGRIEAESFTTMAGVQTETTDDAGRGLDVGWIDQGDWMDYNVNVATAGNYTVTFRIATPNTGTAVQLRKADGTVLLTQSLPATGDWQTWQTAARHRFIEASKTLRLIPSGIPWREH